MDRSFSSSNSKEITLSKNIYALGKNNDRREAERVLIARFTIAKETKIVVEKFQSKRDRDFSQFSDYLARKIAREMQSSRLFIRPKLAKSVSRKREWRILHGQSKLATSSVERNFIFFFYQKINFPFAKIFYLDARIEQSRLDFRRSLSFSYFFLSSFRIYK